MKKIILLSITLLFSISASAVSVGVGSTRDEVLAELGLPRGKVRSGGQERLIYDGGTLVLEDALVIKFPENFAERETQAKEQRVQAEAHEAARRAFVQKQTERGLIFYKGIWITPEQRHELQKQEMAEKQIRLIEEQQKQIAGLQNQVQDLSLQMQQNNQTRQVVDDRRSYAVPVVYGGSYYPNYRRGSVCTPRPKPDCTPRPVPYRHTRSVHSAASGVTAGASYSQSGTTTYSSLGARISF